MSVCMFICMLPMAGRTAGPIKTTLGIGTHVDPRSVLVKVIYRGPHTIDRYKEGIICALRCGNSHLRS